MRIAINPSRAGKYWRLDMSAPGVGFGPRTKFARQLTRRAKKLGYQVSLNKVGHLRCYHPATGTVIVLPSTGDDGFLRRATDSLVARRPLYTTKAG